MGWVDSTQVYTDAPIEVNAGGIGVGATFPFTAPNSQLPALSPNVLLLGLALAALVGAFLLVQRSK